MNQSARLATRQERRMLYPPGGLHWQLRGEQLPPSCVGFQIVGISDAMPVGLKMRRPSRPLSCGIDFVLCVYS